MSKHAHLNLMEVKNSLEGRVEGLEGRFGRGPMDARDIGVSLWRYAPNLRNPTGHKHREQEEAYLVVSGSGEVLIDGEVIELREWDLVRVDPRPCARSPPARTELRSWPSAARSPRGATGRPRP